MRGVRTRVKSVFFAEDEDERNYQRRRRRRRERFDAWCGHIEESVKRVCSKTYDTEEERLRALEHENVRRSVENVQTYPFVRERVAKGELRVRGGFFTIRSGEVAMMDEDTKAFTPIKVDDT